MPIARCAALSVLLLGASESTSEHPQSALDGRIVCVAAGATAAVAPDVATALGTSEQPGQPFDRLAFDWDEPVLAASGFMRDDQRTGTLAKDVGGSPLPGDSATADPGFAWSSAEASFPFDVSLGSVTTSRCFVADYFDCGLEPSEVHDLASETGPEAPVPIDLAVLSAPQDVGCMGVDIDDTQARLLDVETVLTVHATSLLDLFVGYRVLELTADGILDDDRLDTDAAIRGLVIGGGLRF